MIIRATRIRTLVSLALAVSLLAPAAGAQAKKPAAKPAKKEQPTPATATAPTPPLPPDYGAVLENLSFRSIGPAIMGGRIDDFAVVENDPRVIYAGTASGGIFKSVNGGTTWQPIFDNEAVSTIGDLALAPSDPMVLWVGTGESNNRQSSSWGNGVYKSLDGGKTWQQMGLSGSHHIGRIVVHPRNPEIVYVAAAGHLWGPNRERGVYKTSDGGKTWNQVLFISEDTGINDIAIDSDSPDTLYAGAYQRRRTVFGFNGGGPEGAIYKTSDGGVTWKKLVKGLPYEQGGDTGRIGLAVYRKSPNIVYALVEHSKGGIFRSEDRGETWTRMSETNPRPAYYSQVVIDPNNDLRVWVLGAPLYFSEDGGKTFVTTRGQLIHSDFHAMWIDPQNSEHIILGSDGGITLTWDGGRTWDFANSIPLGQFYEIGVDMQKPYHICGGLQDNNTWCGPSATTYARGISNDEWVAVGGGDGFYAQVDPTDPNTVYAESQDGNLLRRDMRTGESRSIRPREKPDEARYRFQWNSPVLISRHDPKTIYYGGNLLFKSTDRGDNWVKVSPDLTSGVERGKLAIMGKLPDKDTLSRNDGVQQYPCITTIAESALNPNTLWVGTDDGHLQVTRDGGRTWKNVVDRVPDLPKGTYVTRVIVSNSSDGTAYATFDGHRTNDFGIYVYMTPDYGETWKNIGGGLPRNNGIVNVIREHPKNADLLLVGTEYGTFASWDRGANWTRMKMGVPTVPVDDILIHPRDNDLIFGTHGRSIWVLDDMTPLQQLNEKVLQSDLFLFDTRPATSWRLWNHKWFASHREFVAPNPPSGAIINYYLKEKLGERERVRITIQDKNGKSVRELTCGGSAPTVPPAGSRGGGGGGGMFGGGFAAARCDAKPGINRATWDLRQSSPMPLDPGQAGGEGGASGFFGGARGPLVDPGEFTVKIAVVTASDGPGAQSGGTTKWEMSKPLKVEEDPRVSLSDADRAARRQALGQLTPLVASAGMAQRQLTALRTNLSSAIEGWKRPGSNRVSEDIRKKAEELLKKTDDLYPEFGTPPSEVQPLGNAGPPLVERPQPLPMRVRMLSFAIEGYSAPPTATDLEEIKVLTGLVKTAAEKVRALVNEDLAALNKMMRDSGVPYISAQAPAEGGGVRRPPEEP
jgi:photosystem II stability/assembly factor-like uncharacterized protein